MASRTRWLTLAAIVVLALSACSTPANIHKASPSSAAAIYLAVSQTCQKASSSDCVSVGGDYVLRPAAFQRAGVTKITVVKGDTQSEVNLTLSTSGLAVAHALSKKAVEASDSARLVVKASHTMLSAVTVMQALTSRDMQVIFRPYSSARKAADLIRKG